MQVAFAKGCHGMLRPALKSLAYTEQQIGCWDDGKKRMGKIIPIRFSVFLFRCIWQP